MHARGLREVSCETVTVQVNVTVRGVITFGVLVIVIWVLSKVFG